MMLFDPAVLMLGVTGAVEGPPVLERGVAGSRVMLEGIPDNSIMIASCPPESAALKVIVTLGVVAPAILAMAQTSLAAILALPGLAISLVNPVLGPIDIDDNVTGEVPLA
jgi:hypothetical protein